ncbi:hypothetical protein R1sor_016915 [Riccia sorocarpa]|uniref:Plant heme peroxidase family profile domain-containing protein n=1 Tax=Riccia sorocarpa TaxID=122646 RepID=A0ABD3HIC6_9MARC
MDTPPIDLRALALRVIGTTESSKKRTNDQAGGSSKKLRPQGSGDSARHTRGNTRSRETTPGVESVPVPGETNQKGKGLRSETAPGPVLVAEQGEILPEHGGQNPETGANPETIQDLEAGRRTLNPQPDIMADIVPVPGNFPGNETTIPSASREEGDVQEQGDVKEQPEMGFLDTQAFNPPVGDQSMTVLIQKDRDNMTLAHSLRRAEDRVDELANILSESELDVPPEDNTPIPSGEREITPDRSDDEGEKTKAPEVSKPEITLASTASTSTEDHQKRKGCDGSVLLDSALNNPAEKDSPANFNSLRGFKTIDIIKVAVEPVYWRTAWNISSGRRDG